METEKREPRPNFFLLLGLNPSSSWDNVKFAQALKQKRAEWSRQSTTSIGQRASQAKKNIELIPQIERVMQNEQERLLEAQNFFTEQASDTTVKVDKFEMQIRLFNAKDSYDQKELDALTKEFNGIISPQDIRKRITIPLKQTSTTSRSSLDTTTSKAIAERLRAIHMSSLYELFDCPPTTSTPILLQKANQLYKDASMNSLKTQEVTYKSELSGYAKVVFSSEAKRKEYDESLRQERFTPLLKELDDLINTSTDREVTLKQTEMFLDNAQKAGWHKQEALQKLKEHARIRKWALQTPAIDTPQKIVCGNCGVLNNSQENYCTGCRQELFINCPDCNQRVSGDQNACGNCGFAIGNRYLVDTQLNALQLLITKKELPQALTLLEDTKNLWKPKKADRRTQDFERYQAELQKLEHSQTQAVAQLQKFVTQKNFFAARLFLSSPDAALLIDRGQQQHTINNAIAKAEILFKQSQLSYVDRNEKINLCRQALLLCSDYQDARDLLRSLPPAEAQNLQSKVRGTVISLSWEASPTSDISYRILCKAHAQPNSSGDGKVLATITGLTYEDDQPQMGIPLYYAVFSEYEQITSAKGALLAQPILLMEDVTLPRAEVNDHLVKISWHPASNAHAYTIVRKERMPPTSMQDGKIIAECDAQQHTITDHAVENGHSYYYVIYTRFKNHEGRLLTSPGARLQASPESPPQIIRTLMIEHQPSANSTDGAIKLNWQRPNKGQAIILKSTKSLQSYHGQVLAQTQLGALGEYLEDQPEMVLDAHPSSGIVYYTPIVLFNKLAYMGPSQRYARVNGVTQLQYKNLGTAIRLQWHWPEDCQETLITFNLHEWPEAEDTHSTTIRVSRLEYERTGYYDLQGTAETRYYIVVTAIVTKNSEKIPAQGARVTAYMANISVITYEIKHSKLFRQRTSLSINTRTPGLLPTLVLIGTNNRLPTRKTDGHIITRIETTRINAKGLEITLPTNTLVPATFGKLFLEDDSLYEMVQIHHPHEDKLRIH